MALPRMILLGTKMENLEALIHTRVVNGRQPPRPDGGFLVQEENCLDISIFYGIPTAFKNMVSRVDTIPKIFLRIPLAETPCGVEYREVIETFNWLSDFRSVLLHFPDEK